MNNQYTGREIAVFTDAHGLYEPTLAVLEDIKKRGITEIYSLGDNIGVGPNSKEVLDLLEQYNVKSVAGNSEEYVTLGIEPFISYFNDLKIQSQLWTLSKLSDYEKSKIKLFPRTIELILGEKKVALCHFANDVRIDFDIRSTWTYQTNIQLGKPAYKQFLYTNSQGQIDEIENMIKKYGVEHPFVKGYLSAKEEPLFGGKNVQYFDDIIQGHVHWKLQEQGNNTNYHSIRAVGMAYQDEPVDSASYVILKEKEIGFELEEILVKYDRDKMIDSILSSDNPDRSIEIFTNIKSR